MTLGGLWHGASWTFVVWGVLHGLLLIGQRIFQGWCDVLPRLRRAVHSAPGTVGRIVLTFLLVSLCWIFFRAQSFHDAVLMFRGLFRTHGLELPTSSRVVVATLVVFLTAYAAGRSDLLRKTAARLPAPVEGAAYAFLLGFCLLLAPLAKKSFIYFQF